MAPALGVYGDNETTKLRSVVAIASYLYSRIRQICIQSKSSLEPERTEVIVVQKLMIQFQLCKNQAVKKMKFFIKKYTTI